ncbi:DNA polymerase III catalytic subunit, PolC type [Granulicatella balaenopterae]|uniref:DNA polymerase III PolC-type n=1 Tax=Granulicatella balaenopterae TaxID=137733 RepID=A0A1H9L628_9LACT|nr:PolC-type DNA polymerase III [Granulicatella balaenopterae]SER06607.1 DNA polymerase III catalytic subunit, PolC type [Granulicatella balaenopterae]
MNSQEALLLRLMDQLHLADNEFLTPDLEKAKLLKIDVHKLIPRWEFYIETETVINADKFRIMYQRLMDVYQTVAEVKMVIIPRQKEVVSPEMLTTYWPIICDLIAKDSPMFLQLLAKQTISVSEGHLVLHCQNDITKEHIKEKYIEKIKTIYQEVGISPVKMELVVDEAFVAEKEQAHKQKQNELENQWIQQAQVQKEIAKTAPKQKTPGAGGTTNSNPNILYGKLIRPQNQVLPMDEIFEEERNVTIEGKIFDIEIKTRRNNGKPYGLLKITDYSSSIGATIFATTADDEAQLLALKKNTYVKCFGNIEVNRYTQELTMVIRDINVAEEHVREDTVAEEEKRVELHLHTNMSVMDATNSASDLVARAAKWGHKAVAITDHANLQAYPEAHGAGQKHGIKIHYGVEGYVVDTDSKVAYNPRDIDLDEATYVVFDVETTGLSAVYDKIIELAAVKMYKGNVVEKFEEFIDPGHPLSATTIQLTGITDDMVRGSKSEEQVLREFQKFAEGTILVAHNASFDMGFLNKGYNRYQMGDSDNPVIDTLELSRKLHPHLKSHRLNTLSKKYGVVLEQHHRAIYDSEATGVLCHLFLKEAANEHHLTSHYQLNKDLNEGESYKNARPFHATIFAKHQKGLKTLFKVVSDSNVHHFYRVPRILRSLLVENRDDFIIGSGCADGEVFTAMMQKGYEEAKEKAKFYDYIEVMPKAVYRPLIGRELIRNEKHLEEIIKNLVKLGKELNKPVVATGNVHYLDPRDSIYREILVSSLKNMQTPKEFPEVHFRTTNEMLEEFAFLGEDIAREIVITNSQLVSSWLEEIIPIKDELYTPKIDGAEDEITKLSYDKAREWYGQDLPEIVEARIKKELDSIIGNGFSVIYLISQKLVLKSNQDGYLVGSRGSVGSSLVATLTGITEVNPLAPHYRCPNCCHSEFFDDGSIGSGFDLPEKDCPHCHTRMKKDGHDIPFETFLGFYGDKVPDIDLNFSGEYQPQAHNYTKVLFGEDYVFRAGTISTVADKTAFGYVKGYERDHGFEMRQAEIDRLAQGCTGVKRSTGQHPGGIIVIPDYMDVYDFTPIQYPADDQNSDWRTTHFDFHSIHDNVLKLDILGHDDPTVIRMLQDLSGLEPADIPPDDPEVMKIFGGTEVLGVTPEQIDSKTGTLGIPEFGTRFVRGMLEQTKPTTFAELLQISGLSHGTDVYLGNAEELIRLNGIPLAEVIGCRDDIMVYLIHKGVENGKAFKIMEGVRKGKGIPDELQADMRAANVPEWYIESCLKIKYMFPKAHAAAYVLMALRVAYFKVHKPLLYYCAYFSVRAQDFDIVAMSQGKEMIKARMKEIRDKGMDASTKENNVLTVLELANEMCERGFTFKMVDLEKSDATNFVIDGDSLIAPFRAVPGLGMNVATKIIEAREEKPFLSKKDLATRGKVSKTLIDYLTENKVLDGLPDENQLSLFDF